MSEKPIRHILGLSGGKDSAALAIYMRDRVPEMEYVFADTKKELPETYEFLAQLEAYLGKPVVRLNSERGFDHWLEVHGNFLPSARMRWCTRLLKLIPFERYVGEDPVVNYVGIRADEDREGYISTKANIESRFPFKEDGITMADVIRILEDSGLGIPEYYKWRTRSGCYFCFFQRKIEWIGLKENHPDLFEQAKDYEKTDPVTGARYTWQQGESLGDLERPARVAQILDRQPPGVANARATTLAAILDDRDHGDEEPCLICDL